MYPKHLEETFLRKTPKSREAYERAKSIIPSASPGGLGLVHYPYQVFIDHGEGCYMWDLDRNRYLDLVNGDWLMPLGHGNPQVKAAIAAQLEKGTTFAAPPGDLGYELASLIQQRMPSVEMIRFATSGTEANQNAMRVARTFTGRGKIAKLSGAYHGTADQLVIRNGLNTDPRYEPPGLMPGTREDVVLLPPNDAEACEKIIEREKDHLAAVLFESIMGVCGFLCSSHEFVRRIRAITEKYGILLIFDEVVTMPLDTGGAQGYYKVKPDLTTFGKAIGGGLPLAAYGGRRDVMGLLDPHQHELNPPLAIAATMGGMAICLAAGIAAIKQLTPQAHRHLHALGDHMRDGIAKIARKHNVPLQATGIGHFTGIHWTPTKVVDYPSFTTSDRRIIDKICFSLATQGFLAFAMGFFVLSTPMTTADIDQFLAALEQALKDNDLIG
ncbi:MAG TPA: aminotransferase class III-fold pyridoxal phosphate-dependent enzyme [Candidatus Binataceae bacterium]|nr:aminotransferase class III-fold pyridoxal phosphate-dependent enzyme [Candidatus Binataceae bacterium]